MRRLTIWLAILAIAATACAGPAGSSGGASPDVATSKATASPAVGPSEDTLAAPPPNFTFEAGSCIKADDRRVRVFFLTTTFGGICLRDAVGAWLGVPFTPTVTCSAPTTTCTLKMNVFAPTSHGPWPLVVLSPGGPAGPADQFYLDAYAALLASRGVVVMESAWRQTDFAASGYPTAFADVACAIGVARKTGSDYGANPDRVTLVGHSLGGWATAILLLTPTPFSPAAGSCDPTTGSLRPDAVAIVDGAMNEPTTTLAGEITYVRGFLGGDRNALPAEWAAVDPYALAKRYPAGTDAIPTVLIHGAADDLVPPAVTKTFQTALVAGGYQSQLLEIPSADHVSVLTFEDTLAAIVSIAHGR